MDFQFSSKLQTALHDFGRKNGFAPPKSQDPSDAILHEYYVSETARSIFDKRRKAALEKLKALDDKGLITRAVKEAADGKTGTINLIDAENYNATLTTKSPVKSIDVSALTNALVKYGVDQVTINKALNEATKQAKPAESYTVSVKVS